MSLVRIFEIRVYMLLYLGFFMDTGLTVIGMGQKLDSLAEKVEQFISNPTKLLAELIPATRPHDASKYNEEATTKQGEDPGASFEDTIVRIDSEQRGQLAAKNEERTLSVSQAESSGRISHTCTEEDAVGKNSSTETAKNTWQGARFHDLKDRYIHLCLDLLTAKAAEDGNMEELDQLEKSLVEDIRELTNVYNLHPHKLLEQFEKRWQHTYGWLFAKCEFYTKQSLLASIKNTVKLIKHMVLKDGVIGSPRDYSLLFPVDGFVNCHRRMQRILKSMEPEGPTVKEDDIPLD